MRCVVDPDPAGFAEHAWAFLSRDPVLNNIICTHVDARIRGERPTVGDELWLRVHAPDGELVGAAMCTPPRGLLLGTMPPEAALAAAEWAAVHRPELPSVDGPVHLATPATNRYAELTGARITGRMSLPIFRLDTVDSPAGVPGQPREATGADRDRIIGWMDDFDREAMPPGQRRADTAEMVDGLLATGGLAYLWELAGEPVSMAYRSALTRVPVVRISGVYTPPAYRGRGYASANVARLSQRSLDDGAVACMLYTDAANPTSNKIYHQIGYRPVGESVEWLLSR